MISDHQSYMLLFENLHTCNLLKQQIIVDIFSLLTLSYNIIKTVNTSLSFNIVLHSISEEPILIIYIHWFTVENNRHSI